MKYAIIGSKIREKRHKRGMTQQQLADSIGVTWEMVSRYERGDSSPLNRIEALAETLRVSPLELLQEYYKSSTTTFDSMVNNIPLFIKTPSPLLFTKENTTHFYNAPVWVTQRDKDVFAIEHAAIISKTSKITEGAIIYVSPNTKRDSGSIVLYSQNKELICDISSKVPNSADVIGVVVAQEVRM